TFFVNYAHETIGTEVTLDTFDPETGIITVEEDLPGTPDLNNQYTTAGFFFPENISLDLYEEYGRYWIYEYHRCHFIYAIPPNQSNPPKVNINLTDTFIYGFSRQMLVSVANGLVKYYGTECKHERNEIA